MIRALFPGTFDPIHFGHIDIAKRAVRIFDELVVAVYDRPLKSLMFLPEERISLVKEAFKGNSQNINHRLQRDDRGILPADQCPGDRAWPARFLGFRIRIPHGAGKPPPGTRHRKRSLHHRRGPHLPIVDHSAGDRQPGRGRIEHGPGARGSSTKKQGERPKRPTATPFRD